MRRWIGLLFVQHDIGLERLDSHVLKQTETSGEIAVKYWARLSANLATACIAADDKWTGQCTQCGKEYRQNTPPVKHLKGSQTPKGKRCDGVIIWTEHK